MHLCVVPYAGLAWSFSLSAEWIVYTETALSSKLISLSRRILPRACFDLSIALSAEIVVLEDLHVRGMLANHCLAKILSDSALGRLATMVEYKAERAGEDVLWAPRFFPSTKLCSSCGVVRSDLTLSDRQWTCSSCQAAHDRDANAAKNLRALGEQVVVDSQAALPGWAKPWDCCRTT